MTEVMMESMKIMEQVEKDKKKIEKKNWKFVECDPAKRLKQKRDKLINGACNTAIASGLALTAYLNIKK